MVLLRMRSIHGGVMYRRYVHGVIIIVAMVLIFGAVAGAQTPTTTDNPFPSRGFLPGTLVLESDAGDVSINSGNLNYQVPMYRFPGGPGSVPLDVGLVYNSFIYDADGNVNTSQSGGGWQYSFQYRLLEEPVPGACFGSSWGSSGVSTSIVFPDGSRHVLHFNGPSNYNVTFEGQVVCPVNTPPLTGSLNFFTVDGTYVRVQTTAGGSGAAPYKVFLPDGTQLEGSGTASPTKMTDRNGNVLTIVAASRTTPGDGTFLPTFIITDQVGRRIELSYTLDENNVPTDTITFSAPGLARSEERRVGKEWRSGVWLAQYER